MESSNDLSVLVEELGEHIELESIGIIKESDDEEDEGTVRLQETYNSLLEKTGEYAKVAKTTDDAEILTSEVHDPYARTTGAWK